MNSVNKIIKLAERFAYKLSLADKLPMPAQPGDIPDALEPTGLWGRPDDLFPLADQVGIPGNVEVILTINVDANLDVTFKVATTPATPAAAIKLASLLKQKYATSFKAAIQSHFQKNKIIPRPVSAGWHTFGPPKK